MYYAVLLLYRCCRESRETRLMNSKLYCADQSVESDGELYGAIGPLVNCGKLSQRLTAESYSGRAMNHKL